MESSFNCRLKQAVQLLNPFWYCVSDKLGYPNRGYFRATESIPKRYVLVNELDSSKNKKACKPYDLQAFKLFCNATAESEGFEPPDLLQSTVFKTAAFDHSASSPGAK